MVYRCNRPSHKRFKDYGARGIQVCQRWLDNFWAFVEDMGPRPEGKVNERAAYVLDRIDNDGHYEPGNVRWADTSLSSKNRRPELAWPVNRPRDQVGRFI
jgi:hypothetical protein